MTHSPTPAVLDALETLETRMLMRQSQGLQDGVTLTERELATLRRVACSEEPHRALEQAAEQMVERRAPFGPRRADQERHHALERELGTLLAPLYASLGPRATLLQAFLIRGGVR